MRTFPSKILLFGEHIINKNAHGLAIPYPKLYCALSFNKQHPLFYNASSVVLLALAHYIKKDDHLRAVYNIDALFKDIHNGLGFLMNIPIGYGLGSSGALVAAIYDNYAHYKEGEIHKLKILLAKTEGFFHGKSSGLDPIVSYLNRTVLIETKPKIISDDLMWKKNFNISLLDTSIIRKTAPLVQQFSTHYENDGSFKKIVDDEIIPLNNRIISNFIANKEVFQDIKKLSTYQLQNFSFLIVDAFLDIWKKGIENDSYYIKLCGAGGGGYFLVFSKETVHLPNLSSI